jgi:hypothetical protein
MIQNIPQHTKVAGDVLSWTAIVSSIAGWLQPVTAVLASLAAFAWSCLQIYDWYKKKKKVK